VPGELVELDAVCFAPPALLATRKLRGSDFPAGGFTTHSLTIDCSEETNFLSFRVRALGKTAIAVDYLDLVALPADPSAGK
jgi:hypothetical protein